MGSLHIRQVGYSLVFVALCLVYAISVVGAAPKEHVAEGTYLMHKSESREIAEQRALWKAKKEILPKLKKEVEDFLESKGISGSAEEMMALANITMEVVVTETSATQRDDGTEIKVKAKVTLSENAIDKAFAIAEDTFRETCIVQNFVMISKDIENNERALRKAIRALDKAQEQQEGKRLNDRIRIVEQQFKAITYFEQGTIQSFYRRTQQAIESFSRSIACDENYTESYSELGFAYLAAGNHQEAIKQFEKAASLDAKQSKPLLGKALLALSREEYEQAIQQFTQAIKINKELAFAYYYRALGYTRLAKYDLALSDLAKTVELDPWYAKAYRLRADTYNAKGLYEEAIQNYDIALHLNAAWFELYYDKAVACEKAGKIKEAVAAYRSFISNAPEIYAFLKVSARNKIRQMEG